MRDNQAERAALSVEEFCAWASISKATFYREASAGRLTVRKIGRKSVVTLPDRNSWLSALPVARMAEVA